jgi:microsomal epoxide hydrolase
MANRREVLQTAAAAGVLAATGAQAQPVVRPFKIAIPESELVDLQNRLARTRWPESVPGSGWDYGADVGYIRRLCDYWRTNYDWRRTEARLNAFSQAVTEIDGVDIHFWYVRGTGSNPIPLLMLHGWPGSNFEFLELLGPLSDPAGHGAPGAPAFDLIVPAHPGFGFSGKPKEKGWGFTRIATAFDKLMTERLGYRSYGVQGGDIGFFVGGRMAQLFPERVRAFHTNLPYVIPPGQRPDTPAIELGYRQIQATKPDSLTLAQADSPAGLAAWIVEKFRAWSDCDGDVERAVSRETLVTNLMFYWLTNSAPSAARLYFDSANEPPSPAPPSKVPTAVAAFPKEPFKTPRAWVETRFNVVRWTDMPKGGHFAALEQPALLTNDVRAFFADYRA